MKGERTGMFTRRPVMTGILATLGLVATGFFAYELPAILGSRQKPTPFDDLLSELTDRAAASRLGSAVLAARNDFDSPAVALQLRARLKQGTLTEALVADLAQGQVIEIHGWVLPTTFALLCALAAKAGQV